MSLDSCVTWVSHFFYFEPRCPNLQTVCESSAYLRIKWDKHIRNLAWYLCSIARAISISHSTNVVYSKTQSVLYSVPGAARGRDERVILKDS